MRILGAAKLFLLNSVWRLTGYLPAGRALIRTLGDNDEDLRVIAGMFLVRAGSKAEILLQDALRKRESLPMVLSILADIGDQRFERELQQFTEDRDPKVARAAKDALRVLAAHQ